MARFITKYVNSLKTARINTSLSGEESVLQTSIFPSVSEGDGHKYYVNVTPPSGAVLLKHEHLGSFGSPTHSGHPDNGSLVFSKLFQGSEITIT